MARDDASSSSRGDNQNASVYENVTSYEGPSSASLDDIDDGHKITIKADRLVRPDPITLFFGFGGPSRWNAAATARIANRIENTRVMLRRQPTQDEVDAFAEHSSRNLYYSRTGVPIGLGCGLGWTYHRARQGAYFPVEVPPATAGQLWEGLKNLRRFDPGAFAQVLVKTGARTFLWVMGAVFVTSTYATWNDAVTAMRDPRLQQFVADLKRYTPEDLRRRKAEALQERLRHVQRAKSQRHQEEPYLPGAAGVLAESHEHDSYGESEDDSLASRPSQDQPRSMPDRSKSRIFGDQATTSSANNNNNNNNPADFFDDASPTNPEYRNDDGSLNIPGNSWERIRQQNMSGGGRSNASQERGVREHFQSGSSYDSSDANGDRDRQRERERAQRDFDKLLEAERNVSSDPSGTGGQNKGWGSWGR